MHIQLVVILATLVSTAAAHGVELAVDEGLLAQNTGAPDRGAAGNGSMGTGNGIDYIERDRDGQATQAEPDGAQARPLDNQQTESGHGGNETDMEHRRRPRLEKHND